MHFFLVNFSISVVPVSEIAIVSMISMLFPWHFSGILWHPGGIPWNAMEFHGMTWMLCYFHGISVEFYGIQVECHGIPWNAMDVILFPWHFSGILWHPGGMPWTLYYFHGI